MSAADGVTKWKKGYPTSYHDSYGKGDGPRATPLVADGRIYTLGADGVLQCLKLEDGEKVWRKDAAQGLPGAAGLFRRRHVAAAGGRPAAGERRRRQRRRHRGLQQGRRQGSCGRPTTTTPATRRRWPPTSAGKRQAVFLTREGLISLDPADGAIRYSKHWRSRMDASVNAASPVVVGDQIFLTACYGTGAVLLRAKADGWKRCGAMTSRCRATTERRFIRAAICTASTAGRRRAPGCAASR